MPEFLADGVKIYYDSSGFDSRHIILVHAYPTNRRLWEPQIAALDEHRTVIAYDVRGFGRSGVPDDPAAYSQDRSVADLLTLLDHLGLERADICGLSMGGNIALNFALAHPHRVSSLIVSGTGAGSDDAQPFLERLLDWAATAERLGIRAFADKILQNAMFAEYASRGARESAHLLELILENSATGVALTARHVIAKRAPIPHLERSMQKLNVPTLVIAGERDPAVALSTALMVRAIPNAQLRIIPGTGHFNNLEAPDLVNRVLLEFLMAEAQRHKGSALLRPG